jgi:hypothetical protein
MRDGCIQLRFRVRAVSDIYNQLLLFWTHGWSGHWALRPAFGSGAVLVADGATEVVGRDRW